VGRDAVLCIETSYRVTIALLRTKCMLSEYSEIISRRVIYDY